ncbi:MAG: HD-GYP domain-containing protein [Coriobacteriia bacterium]
MVGIVGLAVVPAGSLILSSALAGIANAAVGHSSSARFQSIHRLLDAGRASALLGILAPTQHLISPMLLGGPTDEIIARSMVIGVAYAMLDLTTVSVQQSITVGSTLRTALPSLVKPLGAVYVVQVPLSAVVLRLHDLSWWPFAVAVLLAIILQNSFSLYLRIRRAYTETIGALASAAELDRPSDSGHAQRVSDLSVAVGRRLGLSRGELERVGYAALLHDVGRLGVGAAEAGDAHLRRGAEIVARIPFLADVAPLIFWSRDERCAVPPIGWMIVITCSRYDQLKLESGEPRAIELLRLEESHPRGRILKALEEIVIGRDGAAKDDS